MINTKRAYVQEQLVFQGTECCPQYRWEQQALSGSKAALERIRNRQNRPERWRVVPLVCKFSERLTKPAKRCQDLKAEKFQKTTQGKGHSKAGRREPAAVEVGWK